jgi:hypothetical protein
MDWLATIKSIAPTVATALGGPLAGAAVSAIGNIIGQDNPTPATIAQAITDGKLTPDHLAEIRKLELQYQNDEKERGFKYADLAFQDRADARKNNTASGIQNKLFYMSLLLLTVTLGAEGAVLFNGLPSGLSDMVAGRVLGLADSVSLLVLTYYYGSTHQQPPEQK